MFSIYAVVVYRRRRYYIHSNSGSSSSFYLRKRIGARNDPRFEEKKNIRFGRRTSMAAYYFCGPYYTLETIY